MKMKGYVRCNTLLAYTGKLLLAQNGDFSFQLDFLTIEILVV